MIPLTNCYTSISSRSTAALLPGWRATCQRIASSRFPARRKYWITAIMSSFSARAGLGQLPLAVALVLVLLAGLQAAVWGRPRRRAKNAAPSSSRFPTAYFRSPGRARMCALRPTFRMSGASAACRGSKPAKAAGTWARGSARQKSSS